MYAVPISHDADEDAFRSVARRCLDAGIEPATVTFADPAEPSLLPEPPPSEQHHPVTVSRGYAKLLSDAACHRAPDRFALLYEVLWRLTHGERDLLDRATDPAIAQLNDYAHNVRRDIHKMHAFLRFRERRLNGKPHYTAWFEPQHYVLKAATPHFVDRFPNMDWLIATPAGTAIWQDGALRFGPASEVIAADDDVLDELWLTYYRTTFNPARVRVKAMTAEMPKHYWHNMPETRLVPELVAGAANRVVAMDRAEADQPALFAERIAKRRSALTPMVPTEPLAKLRAEATTCQRCPLYANATQTVFGEGPENARLMFVGEQPGDQEDIAGKPFVGPAGEVFDRAIAQAGIVRNTVYVTNAVKHFKFEPRGKRRIHMRPNAGEVKHCRWWLEREIAAIEPKLIVALGATAAQSLSGHSVSVLRQRGPASFSGKPGFITVHPSFLLRLPDEKQKKAAYADFVADLRRILEMLDIAA
jgi:probable DNA metabolism protein